MTQNKKKSYEISKYAVYQAYLKVKEKRGSAGVDNVDWKTFEGRLQDNLYKIWNRMSSGCYFPKAVKRVEIPKKDDGSKRPLGIPTIADRIAQMVVKDRLEGTLEKIFHPNSYGYRPNKSCGDALEAARRMCWTKAWVIDVDIKGFFENIDHDLMMKAVYHVTGCKWAVLYIERWLKGTVSIDGKIENPSKGTPQGGVISPLLANLYLHYAFDMWMERYFESIAFERYADDIVIHFSSEQQAKMIWYSLVKRMKECGLELHPDKTKIVYCRDGNKGKSRKASSFDVLGFTFKLRQTVDKRGKRFIGFNPSISKSGKKSIMDKVKGWSLNKRVGLNLSYIAKRVNPQIRGWKNYYGQFRSYDLMGIWLYIDRKIMKWAMKKYKGLRKSSKKTWNWLLGIVRSKPYLFEHWRYLHKSFLLSGRSRMN